MAELKIRNLKHLQQLIRLMPFLDCNLDEQAAIRLSKVAVPLTDLTADATLNPTDCLVRVDTSGADVSVILPPAAGQTRLVLIKKLDAANTLTLLPDAIVPDTIEGAASLDLTQDGQFVLLISDQISNYLVLGAGSGSTVTGVPPTDIDAVAVWDSVLGDRLKNSAVKITDDAVNVLIASTLAMILQGGGSLTLTCGGDMRYQPGGVAGNHYWRDRNSVVRAALVEDSGENTFSLEEALLRMAGVPTLPTPASDNHILAPLSGTEDALFYKGASGLEKEVVFVTKHTVAPGTGDDVNDGYRIGHLWVDTTNDNVYLCESNAAGAANWILI